MKKSVRVGGLFLATALSTVVARPNSITVTEISAVNSAGGGSDWTYDLGFLNSTLNPGDFVNINDFGTATVVSSPGAGWTFSQALVGPNSLPAAATDSSSILNATLTWAGAPGTIVSPNSSTAVNEFVTFHSPASVTATLATSDYTTIDQVTSGLPAIVGTDSRVIGSVASPRGAVPDSGSALMLMGLACLGLQWFRRVRA